MAKPRETRTNWPNGQVNGRIHGQQQAWYSDGQLCYDSNYEHGERHGRQQDWYPDGHQRYDHSFERGEQHGRH